ncbi:hypothetical protein Tco_0788271 [Tanacetum coccineum]
MPSISALANCSATSRYMLAYLDVMECGYRRSRLCETCEILTDLDGLKIKEIGACFVFNFPSAAIKLAIGLKSSSGSITTIFIRSMDSFQGLTPKSPSSWHRPLAPVQIFFMTSLNSVQDEPLTNQPVNDPRDFAKPVKAITLPQDVPNTSDRRLVELENKVQRLMESHLAPTQPTQVNKITTSCEICSGPHDTQYCMENPEQALSEYASIAQYDVKREQQSDPHDRTEENKEEERDSPENHLDSPTPPDPLVSFITEKVLKFSSLFESLGLVPPSPNAELVCTKEEDGDVKIDEKKLEVRRIVSLDDSWRTDLTIYHMCLLLFIDAKPGG